MLNCLSRSHLLPSRRSKAALVAALLIGQIIFSVSASAQTPAADPGSSAVASPAEDTVKLSQFDVTATPDKGYQAANSIAATRYTTDIRDMPMTIDVFTNQFMEDIGAVEISDILRYETGVNPYRSGVQDDVSYTIRGFTNAGNVQLRNGIRKSGLLDTVGEERVEIIQGPMSIINGVESPGGVYNVIMKQPLDHFYANVQEFFGNYDFSRTVLDVSGPLYTGSQGISVNYRVATSQTFNGDWREIATMKKQYLYPIVVLQLGKDTKFTVDTEFSQQKGNPPQSLAWVQPTGANYRIAPPVPYNFSQASHETFAYFRSSNTVLDLLQKIGDHIVLRGDWQYQRRVRDTFLYTGVVTGDLKQITRSSDWNIQSNYNTNYYASAVISYDLGPIVAHTTVGYEHYEGGWFTDHDFRSTAAQQANWTIANPATWNRDIKVLQTVAQDTWLEENFPYQSAYALNQFTYKNRLFANVSVRWDDAWQENNNRLLGQSTSGVTVLPHNRQVSPQYGLLYRVTPTLAAYVDYSQAFLTNLAVIQRPDQSFGPEIPTVGKGWEAGLKGEFFQGMVTANVAAFRINETNVPHNETLFLNPANQALGTFNATLQTGLERTQGVELNANINITHEFQIITGYAYDDAHIIANQANPALDGLREEYAPRNTARFFGRYNWALSGIGDLYMNLGLVYMGDTQGSVDTIKTILPSYATVAAGVGLRSKLGPHPVDLHVYSDNLFDRQYWITAAVPGTPRTIRGSISLKY